MLPAKKILMSLVSAKVTLEYYSGLETQGYIAEAIKDIDKAIEMIIHREGGTQEE